MIKSRDFDCDIDLRDPIGGANPDNVLALIRQTYEGKCYLGAMILRVIELVALGPTRITQNGRPSYGTKSVRARAECLIYNTGDIITGCKVVAKGPDGGIQCVGDRVHVMIDPAKEISPIAVGMVIPVRVVRCIYNIFAPHVVVAATLFLPTNKPIVYKICPQVAPPAADLLANVKERVAQEEGELEKLRGMGVWKFLHKIISGPLETLPGQIDLKTGDLSAEFLIVDPRLSITIPGVIPATSPPDDTVPIPVDAAAARLLLLENYCANLRVLREMSSIYTEKMSKEHAALWRIYAGYTPK